MEYIDIREHESGDNDRKSHFIVKPEYLEVSGNLPHNYKFKPESVKDAEAHIEWLINWIKNEAKGGRA